MKTSNKLLFGALIVVLIAITTIISMSKFYSRSKTSTCQKVTIVRNVATFNEVQVEGNIKVYIHQSQNYRVSVTAASDIDSQINTDVENGKLHVYSKNQFNNDTITVEINLPNLNAVSTSASSQVFIPESFRADTLSCVSTSGSFVKCSLNSKKLECNATSGAEIKLDGNINSLVLKATSGAVIDADAIKGDYCSINGESGAQIYVNDITKLDVKINSGSKLTYSEHSIIGNMNVSNDAELIKKNH